MAIGLIVTKPFAEKCWSLCALIGKCVHAKVMATFLDTKINMMHSFNLHIFGGDLYGICSWSVPVNHMEIKPMVFMQEMLEMT